MFCSCSSSHGYSGSAVPSTSMVTSSPGMSFEIAMFSSLRLPVRSGVKCSDQVVSFVSSCKAIYEAK